MLRPWIFDFLILKSDVTIARGSAATEGFFRAIVNPEILATFIFSVLVMISCWCPLILAIFAFITNPYARVEYWRLFNLAFFSKTLKTLNKRSLIISGFTVQYILLMYIEHHRHSIS